MAGSFHNGYIEPMYAWVPSIAVSNLISVKGKMFEKWKGDLLIGSMRARNIYHIKYKNGRVIYSEPLAVDLDVRDIMEMNNGTIAAMNRRSELMIISINN